jgi:hypothetical protein
MGMPVVKKASGGMPVSIAANGFGTPMTEATNGFGVPVTIVASGGLPVVGISAGGGGGGGGPVAITQAGSAVSTADLTTYTFSTVPIGSAAAGRMNIVGVAVRAVASVTVASVTIDGVAATQAVYAQDLSDSNTTGAAIWAAATPSANATATVTVVLSAAAVRCGINVWKMTGAAGVVPSATDTALDSPVGDISLTVPANGAVCAFGCKADSSFAWSGITQSLAPIDIEGGFYMGAAMKDVTTGGANAMFLANSSATADAAWGPAAGTTSDWILDAGSWADPGKWRDNEVWKD